MSKTIITDFSQFTEIINELESSIISFENLFNAENQNIELINGTNNIWAGKTQEVVYGKYKELEKNYEPIIESLSTYVKFLKITLENYSNFERQVNDNLDSNDVNLNVNN